MPDPIRDIWRLFMLMVWRSAVHSGTAEEASERAADYRRQFGVLPYTDYERYKREAKRDA